MATPVKAAAPKMMEASLEDLGALVKKFKTDLTALVMGDTSKLDDSLMDGAQLLSYLSEVMIGINRPMPVGSPDKAAILSEEIKADCQQCIQMIEAEKPRFVESAAGGSKTEGAKIDNLLALAQKFLPMILQILAIFG